MCGRYASFRDAQDLADEFDIAEISDEARLLPPSWNVAPTDPVRIVVDRPPAGQDGPVRRTLQVAKWGLVPSWSKDPKGGPRMINARAESILDKPAFAKPLAARRCLVPADGYYEWKPAPGTGTSRRPAKQAYYIRASQGPGIAFAGLYEFWRDPAKSKDDPARWLVTTTIVTTSAAAPLAHIHDRMPLALPGHLWDHWLDPQVGSAEAATMLGLGESVDYLATAVSSAVNSVANNGPDLIKPSE